MRRVLGVFTLALAICSANAEEKAEELGELHLWPLISVDERGTDVIWPISHFGKEKNDWRLFPVINQNGLFCVFPELWVTDKSVGLLPFWTTYDFTSGAVVPVVWWGDNQWGSYHSLFPLYYYGESEGEGRMTSWWLAGLGGYTRRGGRTYSHWALPFYYWDQSGSFMSLLYGHTADSNWFAPFWYHDLKRTMITPLAGWNEHGHWFIPLYYTQDDTFVLLLYGHNAQGHWFFPLYDYSSEGDNIDSTYCLLFDYKRKSRHGETYTKLGNYLLWSRETTERTESKRIETRFLWRFWHRIEDNEVVTIEAFPAFSHESRPYGYRKTSLLWRLYRHDYDPDTESRQIDFLFLPVWRSGI